MAPFKTFLGAAIVVTFILKFYCKAYLPSRSLATTAFEILAVEIFAWLVWRCLLYPNLFSPLRALPGPPVCPLHVLYTLNFLRLAISRGGLS